MKRLDAMTNIAVIVTSVALLSFLGNSWYENRHAPQSSATRARALVGRTVELPGVDFTRKGKTLVIAISSTCHFCQESQPFYRQLANMQGNKANLVAVLPMPQRDAEDYVHSTISSSFRVVSASLDTMGISSTPTLILVDSQGRVERAWVGKLDDASQKQVKSQL
jgi:thiol-disulfide isomerase/thioredoxin